MPSWNGLEKMGEIILSLARVITLFGMKSIPNIKGLPGVDVNSTYTLFRLKNEFIE